MSIITVTYDNHHGLKSTLGSIEQQVIDFDTFEVIVVDGGSRDGSKALLESSTLKNMRFVSEDDEGIFDAQNKGARMASGDYFLFLNAGDLLADPHSVSLLHEALSPRPTWLLAGCIDLQGGKGAEKFDHNPSWWLHALGIKAYCQQSIAYSRTLFELLGGFDHNKVGLAADYDFNLRAGLVAKPQRLADVVTLYDGAGISSTYDFQMQIPRMFHAVRVERLQLSGIARAADALFASLFVCKKFLWHLSSRRPRKSSE